MLGTLRYGTHHLGDALFTAMERVFLTAGIVLLTFLMLLIIGFGVFLMR